MRPAIPVHDLALPEYRRDTQPDYAALGPQLDRFIVARFPGRRLALRGLDLRDHPDRSRDDLIQTICDLGTDRYDPKRTGIHHDHYAPLGIEVHAVACEVRDGLQGLYDADYIAAPSVMGEFLADFYESARAERGTSLHLDLLLVYDLDRLVAIPEDRPQGFAFRHPERKREALLAIISINEAPPDEP